MNPVGIVAKALAEAKEVLNATITAAGKAKDGVKVSEDGADLQAKERYANQAAFTALNTAIETAKEAAKKDVKADVEKANSDLNKAIADFNKEVHTK